MSVPDDIISLLRDEAYLTLCRKTIDESLEKVRAQKREVANSRPPFGILAMPSSRKTYEHSMRTVLDTESSLQNRLSKINPLGDWLKTALPAKLDDYLCKASNDYSFGAHVLSVINGWEQGINPYSDHLLAFARELKNSARVIGGAKENPQTMFSLRTSALAGLRLAAAGVDHAAWQLDLAADKLRLTTVNTLYNKVSLVAAPVNRVAEWVDHLVPLSNAESLDKMQSTEAKVRAMLADKLLALHTQAATAREIVNEAKRNYLQNHWSQLRDHALIHYVKDRDVDEVLDELAEHHVAATWQRSQQLLQGKPNPFAHER
ncbi:MAG TPA: hypothetical protein VNW30_03145 [Opitutaceae bacterium]|jgi:hypothetical protein|nr:hypothetical protein [Opitutaceae bacterium]